MTQRSLKLPQGLKNPRQVRRHPGRTLTATATCNTDGPATGKALQLPLFRHVEEEDRFQPVGGEHFHDIG